MIKLSVSSIDTFNNCPKKYEYRYIQRVKVNQPAWNFTEFGSCAHLILEHFHNRVDNDTDPSKYREIMKGCFKDAVTDKQFDPTILRSYVWSPDGDKPGFDYLKEITGEYLDIIEEKGLPNVVGTEVSYEFEVTEGVKIRGFIDRIDKISDTHYKVVDYKTSKNPKYLKEFQLLVYSLAIKRMYPQVETISGSFVLMKHHFKEVEFEFGTMDMDRTFNTIIKKANAIRTEKVWPKNQNRLCDWCDYKSICLGTWAEENEDEG